jgi:DNA-binding MarR family transcriptional regulator
MPREPATPSVFALEFQHGDIDSKLVAALERLGQALDVLARHAATTSGLSPIQLRLLVLLYHDPDPGRRAGALARRFGVTPATLSDALSALEAKSLVIRRPSPDDRRATVVSLTPAGRRLAARLSGWADPAREALPPAPAADRTRLLHFLMAWIEGLQRANIVTVARMCVTCRFFEEDAHPGSRLPHHCRLLDRPLAEADLRVDCAEHEPAA